VAVPDMTYNVLGGTLSLTQSVLTCGKQEAPKMRRIGKKLIRRCAIHWRDGTTIPANWLSLIDNLVDNAMHHF